MCNRVYRLRELVRDVFSILLEEYYINPYHIHADRRDQSFYAGALFVVLNARHCVVEPLQWPPL